MHLVSILIHAVVSELRLVTMTDDHATSANNLIVAIHRVINLKEMLGNLPIPFFIQVDTYSPEIKNKYLLPYVEAMLRWVVFGKIGVVILPVEHTYCDIDQAFSTTSRRLHTHDTVIMTCLDSVL